MQIPYLYELFLDIGETLRNLYPNHPLLDKIREQLRILPQTDENGCVLVIRFDDPIHADGEELEDVVACALGGIGYTGHLTNSLTGNEVHFPVMDEQPLNLLSKAENRAWERYDAEDKGG